jgi:hypothetical protein
MEGFGEKQMFETLPNMTNLTSLKLKTVNINNKYDLIKSYHGFRQKNNQHKNQLKLSKICQMFTILKMFKNKNQMDIKDY